MTEQEKLARARMYIEKLANGVDPLTDQPVAETDVVNNVRISRCLFYVADVLRQTEAGERPRRERKPTKLPFRLSPEDYQAFPYSETPLPITKVVERINGLIDSEQMEKLRREVILDWLVEIGALRVMATSSGSRRKYPTPSGEEMGISTEQSQGPNGPYTAVLYNEAAQRFIMDNLEAVLAGGGAES